MKALLIDYMQIAPSSQYRDLSVQDKVKLIDKALDTEDVAKKGLRITLTVSHSGRRINNRLYSPVGQMAAVKDMVEPYPKPVLLNHDRNGDPIGRYVSGSYTDISSEAIRHLRNLSDLTQMNAAYRSKDWEKLADVASRSGILLNDKWQGLGQLNGVIRVTDKDAIEKFLDGRYLTFSSGATTNALVCSHCFQNWMSDGPCGHRPGEIIDGEIVFHITDEYHPFELSVATVPADADSKVRSIEWIEATDSAMPDCFVDSSTIYLNDSMLGFTEPATETTTDATVETAVVETTDSKEKALLDQLNGDTVYEVAALIRMHDELHYRYDGELRWNGEDAPKTIPRDAFKLHAKLHELADSKKFRDSLLNGALDHYSDMGELTHEFAYEEHMDKLLTAKLQELKDSLKTELLQELKPTDPEECQDGVCEIAQQDTSIDWTALDAELAVELGDATLSTEARSKLKGSQFCGPGRSFPVPDKAHYIAALRLLNRSNYSDSTKEKIRACIMRKGERNGWTAEDTVVEVNVEPKLDNTTQLQDDYRNALLQIDNLKERLTAVLSSHAMVLKKDFGTLADEERLAVMYGWFEELNRPKQATAEDIERVENPSISSTSVTIVTDTSTIPTLDDSQKVIVSRYKKLKADSSERAAETYVLGLKRKGIIPMDFDPNKF